MESQKCYNTHDNRSIPRGSRSRMQSRRERGVMSQSDFFSGERDLATQAERLRCKLFKANDALGQYWDLLNASSRAKVRRELREYVLLARFGKPTPEWMPATWLYQLGRTQPFWEGR